MVCVLAEVGVEIEGVPGGADSLLMPHAMTHWRGYQVNVLLRLEV